MGYPHQYIKNMICVFRNCLNITSDVNASLSPQQTQQILQDYLESKNVQLANFILQQAVVKPYLADEMKQTYDDRLFNQGLIQSLLSSIKIGEKAKQNYLEFINGSICCFFGNRLESGKLLKLKYFKPCNDLIEDYQDIAEEFAAKQNAIKNKKQRATEMKFRLRPWRGKHGVEYGTNKVKKEIAEKVE